MRARALLRRVSSLGRILVALVLLGALWFGTVQAVNDATDRGQEGRLRDRRTLVEVAARPAAAWLESGRVEAQALATASAGQRPEAVKRAIDAYMNGRPRFGRSAVVVERGSVIAASTDRLPTVGGRVTACRLKDAGSDGTTAALLTTTVPVVSGRFALPATCTEGIAAAAAAGGRIALVFGEPGDLQLALQEGAPAGKGMRVTALDAAAQTVGADAAPGVASASQRRFVSTARGRYRLGRYHQGDAEYLAAYQPLVDSWGLMLVQDADAFDVGLVQRPALTTAGVLTAVFASAFALVAWFDVRRRRVARRAEADRTAFLSIVGHELRTPLTVIKGYADTLATRWDALDDGSRRMLVENLAPQAQRQARVIEHLLTAAALQAGSSALVDAEPVDVADLLARAIAGIERLAPLHRFQRDVDPSLPQAWGDRGAIEQVVGELLDNAVRFSPSGGPVLVGATTRRGTVVITVDDAGVGLPSDVKGLFRPFGQAEDVDQRLHAEGGIGVGLFIAATLLRRMGGTISASSRQPRGARFTVELPALKGRGATGGPRQRGMSIARTR